MVDQLDTVARLVAAPALAASLNVTTDRNLDYGEEGHIRPDNLVTLPDMTKAIFESEQDARSDFLERILRSLDHKVAFYASQQAQEFSPIVRMYQSSICLRSFGDRSGSS